MLALKLWLVPLLIAAITLAGRRWGPAVAGWLSAFPVVAGPILYFIALDQGPEFTANAAVGTLSAVLAILAFGICYAWAASFRHWPTSLLAGFSGYALAVMLLTFWSPTLWVAAITVMAALLLAPRWYPEPMVSDCPSRKPAKDIAWRMLAGALLVLLVTHFSTALGHRLSGIFAMFPVMGSVLVVFSHRQSGSAFTIHLLRGMLLGYYAFSVFCIVLALALVSFRINVAFLMALGCALVVQGLTRILKR
jgi:hypothetical protein